MRRFLSVASALAAIFFMCAALGLFWGGGLMAAGGSKDGGTSAKKDVVYPETLFDLAKGNANFAMDLFRELSEEDGNIFFSPVSVSEVLSMAYAGAAGSTAAAFEKVLGYPEKGEDLLALYGHLFLHLAGASEEGKVALKLNNSVWVAADEEVKPEFAEQRTGPPTSPRGRSRTSFPRPWTLTRG